MNLADAPAAWEDPEPMSTLHTLLLFGGVPLLAMAVITLLVMAPSLAKGPRYRPGQEWDATPQAFGGLESMLARERRALPSGRPASPARDDVGADEGTGGASGRW